MRFVKLFEDYSSQEDREIWKEYYDMAKDTSGHNPEFEEKFDTYKFQAPHVLDALRRSKTFEEFMRMVGKFETVKESATKTMTFKDANEAGETIVEMDWDSLVSVFGEDELKAVAENAYGRSVGDGDLYHHLWWNKYIDDFLDPYSFKNHYYNLNKSEPDLDDVKVSVK